MKENNTMENTVQDRQAGAAIRAGRRNSPRATLIVVMMTSFVTTFTGSALSLSIPAISSEFNTGAVSIGWTVTAYILAAAMCSVPFGRIADIKGKAFVLTCGQIAFTVSAFLCSLAWDTASIITFRALQGISSGMIFATNMALLTEVFPPQKRGRIMGLSVSATYLGLSIGPVVGGLLNSSAGWRSIFWCTSAWCAVTAVVSLVSVREPENSRPAAGSDSLAARADLSGCLLFMLAMAAVIYGFSSIAGGIVPVAILAAGFAFVVLFVRNELRAGYPLIRVSLFTGNRVFAFSNIAALLNYAASFAITYMLSIYFQSILGFSSETAGLILITSPLIQAALSPSTGRLSDRVAPARLASMGMALTALGLFVLIFIGRNMPLPVIVAALVLIGVGFAFFSSPNTNAIMGSVDRKDLSVASSVLATSRNIGHSFSMATVTIVVAFTVGNVTLAQAPEASMLTAMHSCFIVMTALCSAGVFFSAARD